jgi:hypothetical protein
VPPRKASLWAIALLVPFLATGCVITEDSLNSSHDPPPSGKPCQIVAYWQNSIAFASDPANGGAQTPGLAGRLYLFGPELGHPMTGDGALFVEMFDETEGKSIKREQWEIDPQTLHRLVHRDFIGWGYTLFLPSGEYKPEMSKLRIRTCYKPAEGTPLYTESVVTMASGNGVVRHDTKPLSFAPLLPQGQQQRR